MNTRRLKLETSLDDPEAVALSFDGSVLRITITAWNLTLIHFTFDEVLHFAYNMHWLLSDLREVLDTTEVMQRALERNYDGEVPADHEYKHYQWLDEDDEVAMEVIATPVSITYEAPTVQWIEVAPPAPRDVAEQQFEHWKREHPERAKILSSNDIVIDVIRGADQTERIRYRIRRSLEQS